MGRRALSAWARRLRAGALVGVSVGLLTAVVAYGRPLLFERAELATYDARARDAARPEAASPDIVMVEISEQDIENAENNFDVTWPWPRSLYGYMTAYAAKSGARAITFDWLFQDRGLTVNDAEEFATAMREADNAVIGLALTRYELVQRATEGAWAAQLARYPTRAEAQRVALQLMAWNARCYVVGDDPAILYYGGKANADGVLAVWRRLSSGDELKHLFIPESDTSDNPIEPTPRQLSADELSGEVTSSALIIARDGMSLEGGEALDIPRLEGMDPPLAIIASAPKRAGNVYQELEEDGILRRHLPLTIYGDRYYASLALATYLVGHPEVSPRIDEGDLVLGNRRIPLDSSGKMTIRFHGRGVYPRFSAFEMVRSFAMLEEGQVPSVPPEALRDKYIIVSAAGQALRDIRVTPVSKLQQGAEIQANALDNMERGDFVRRLSAGSDAVVALVMCLLLAISTVAIWTAIRRVVVAMVAISGTIVVAIGGFWLVAGWLYTSHGLWIAVASPALGASASAFAALLVTSAVERRSKRFVQEALGRYTSAALVEALIEHPEYLSLEWGERRQMSVYFSDIAGFTTISENLEPESLVALLNDYLTNMTDLVLEHGGVVDKYIGDAVMAFWGAPLPDGEHARKAVLCALAMRKRNQELRPIWQKRFGHEVIARAGVNSGPAVVGNMGSRHKYNYTVMGDMVNLASRLEGVNKLYGTLLIISEFTYAEVKDLVDVRELDLIAVKGKERPVVVYEVLDEIGKTHPELLAAVDCFHAGLARYRALELDEAIAELERALAIRPDDGPAKMYIDRCKHFIDEPPPDDWDGVWRMQEK